MTTAIDSYHRTYRRLLELAATMGEDRHETKVPALPLWTIRDTYAHLAGNVADILNDNLEGLGTAPWTAKQVTDRERHSLSDICTEWSDHYERFDAVMRVNDAVWGNSFDLWQHEQDIRAALGEPVDRDPDNVRFMLGFFIPPANSAWPAATPAVRLVADDLDEEWQLGDGTPATAVHGTGYELVRALAGRRSRRQVEALGWDTNPAPHLSNMPAFDFADTDQVD